MEYKPHEYQKYITAKMLTQKKLIAIVDMGLGKTVCTLTALRSLIYDAFEVEKVLVIAPLRVADSTWPDELAKWDHLRGLRMSKVLGTAEQRREALRAKADIYVINRENVKWLVDYYVGLKKWPFDTVVIDESSSFKNSRSQRFKAVRKVASITDRVIELTGTPSPNGLMDLWSQIYLLDQGQRLGRTITAYRSAFFNPGRRNRQVIFDYVIKPGGEAEIYKRIQDIAISLKAADYLKMPERVDNMINLRMPAAVQALYDEMEEESIIELEKQEVVAAGSRAAVTNKLLQMANGAVYGEDQRVSLIHDIKLDALEEIIEDNAGKPILVFYNYRHDLDRLTERFRHLNPVSIRGREDVDSWNRGEIKLLLAHPASMGHGLNLQAGGNIIVWFGLTWSLELYLQAIARLYRQGQTQAVIVHHLIMLGTVDVDIMRALCSRRISQDELIEAVKARIKEHKGGQAA